MKMKMNRSFSLCVFAGRINIVDLQQVGVVHSVELQRRSHVNTRLETQSSFRYRPPPISSSSSSQIINVDWVHVESRASDIAKTDKGVQMVLGQLIDK